MIYTLKIVIVQHKNIQKDTNILVLDDLFMISFIKYYRSLQKCILPTSCTIRKKYTLKKKEKELCKILYISLPSLLHYLKVKNVFVSNARIAQFFETSFKSCLQKALFSVASF